MVSSPRGQWVNDLVCPEYSVAYLAGRLEDEWNNSSRKSHEFADLLFPELGAAEAITYGMSYMSTVMPGAVK